MKMFLRKIIPYILALVIIFGSIFSCYYTAFAAPNFVPGPLDMLNETIKVIDDPNMSVPQKIMEIISIGTLGFCPGSPPNLPTLEEYMNQQISEDTGINKDDLTEDDRKDWFNNNVFIDVDNKSIRTTNNFNTVIKNVAQDYIDSNKVYYGYSLDMQYYDMAESGWGSWTRNDKNFIETYQGSHYCFIWYVNQSGGRLHRYRLAVPKNKASFVMNSNPNYATPVFATANIPGYGFIPYSNLTFENKFSEGCVYEDDYGSVYYNPFTNSIGNLNCRADKVNYRESEFKRVGNSSSAPLFCTLGNIEEIMIYGSYGLFTSSQRGMPPYVITNNWNNFVNNEGDYTLNIDNSNHTSYEDLRTWIEQYFTDHDRYPTSEEINNYITNNNQTIINNYYITPTPTPGPGGTVSGNGSGGNTYVTNNYYVSGNVVPGSGNDPKTGKGIWDFLTELVSKLGDLINTIASSIGDVISALAALPGQIIDFFTIDGEQVSAALSEATVSMNNLKNEVIPSEQIKSTLAPLNISEIYYPKLTIKTPAIIRQYYDEEEIILLDFEKWAKYFVVVRSLLVFSFWFAFIYYTLASVRPHVDIGS